MNRKKESLLWSIDAKHLPGTSYLFGTMHVRDQRAFKNLAFIEQMIERFEAFATELDLSPNSSLFSPQSILLPDNRTLTYYIGERKYAKLHKILTKAFDLDLDKLQSFLPMVISNKIAERILAQDASCSLDEFLSKFALENEKIMLGIESFQEQIDILHHIPLDFQIKNLLQIGRNVKKHRHHLLKLITYYEEGRLRDLYLSSKKSLGKIRKVLLYDRNKIMATRITGIIQERTLFCAVGAAHLAGYKGILRILKKQGFVVKTVSMTSA